MGRLQSIPCRGPGASRRPCRGPLLGVWIRLIARGAVAAGPPTPGSARNCSSTGSLLSRHTGQSIKVAVAPAAR